MEAIGPKLRRQRRRLGFTLDELAARTGISKPYLSLIETQRVANPPSDEKLRRLEQTLQFSAGELVSQAHLQRTPRDVRAVLAKLMRSDTNAVTVDAEQSRRRAATSGGMNGGAILNEPPPEATSTRETTANGKWTNGMPAKSSRANGGLTRSGAAGTAIVAHPPFAGRLHPATGDPLNLDDAYLSGMLAELVDRHRGNIEPITTGAVPIINKVAAGYPSDFTDLSYPQGVADGYLSCPDLSDSDAFAARIHGDSMFPKYVEGDIVVFSPAAATKDGDDCFVRFDDGQTTFKRVFFESDDAGRAIIRLQPRNERYRPQAVPRETVTGLYKAVYRYQRLDSD